MIVKIHYKNILDYFYDFIIYIFNIPVRSYKSLRCTLKRLYKMKNRYGFIFDFIVFVLAFVIIVYVVFYFMYGIQ